MGLKLVTIHPKLFGRINMPKGCDNDNDDMNNNGIETNKKRMKERKSKLLKWLLWHVNWLKWIVQMRNSMWLLYFSVRRIKAISHLSAKLKFISMVNIKHIDAVPLYINCCIIWIHFFFPLLFGLFSLLFNNVIFVQAFGIEFVCGHDLMLCNINNVVPTNGVMYVLINRQWVCHFTFTFSLFSLLPPLFFKFYHEKNYSHFFSLYIPSREWTIKYKFCLFVFSTVCH